ncbi:MAG: hypothetical protein JSV86_04290 [Gemmatimonadota bacterium]|nr:MAG: hypothetical protein JSV86_04290 [Gemmatimonadota bacterium]
MSDPFAEFDALVKELEEGLERRKAPERAEEAPRRRRGLKATVAKWGFRALLFAAALLLPFYLLVGSSVFFYRTYGVPTWPALLAGLLLTVLLLLLYSAWITKRVSGKIRMPSLLPKTLLAVVGAYCLYTLIYISSMNVKGGVEDTYHSLHPLLRLAASTFILVDSDLVVTGMERQPEDYARMGLPLYEHSLHFEQADGYAHAVDLRTIGRSEWRSFLMRTYFRAMGFRTVRHVGTADHLHVSLPMP